MVGLSYPAHRTRQTWCGHIVTWHTMRQQNDFGRGVARGDAAWRAGFDDGDPLSAEVSRSWERSSHNEVMITAIPTRGYDDS